jgi:hypothetical protein
VNGTAFASAATATAGTVITLTATANAEYRFVEWVVLEGSISVEYIGGVGSFTMPTANVTLRAVFELIPVTPTTYAVTFSAGANGTVAATVDGTAITSGDAVEEGAEVVFTATPAENYRVKEWKKDNAVVNGQATTCTVNIAAATTVTVEFEAIPVVITVNTHPAATTTVTAGKITGSLTVSASSMPAATLSYQWYSNTVAINSGGTVISSATGATFTIPTSLTAGTYYYYCMVSAAGATPVPSNPATVTVTGTTGTGETYVTPLKAWTRGGMLHVEGLAEGKVWSIYNVSGALIYRSIATGEEADVLLPAQGVYIIRSEDRTIKIVIN